MQPLNTLPIELFLEKSRIARKSGQKTVNLTIDEASMLEETLAVVMSRLAGDLDAIVFNLQKQETINVSMDGGSL